MSGIYIYIYIYIDIDIDIDMKPMVPMVVNTKITVFWEVMLGHTIAIFQENLRHTSSAKTVLYLEAIITIFM